MNIFDAYDLEQDIIRMMHAYSPKKYFGGTSECLSENPIEYDAKLEQFY